MITGCCAFSAFIVAAIVILVLYVRRHVRRASMWQGELLNQGNIGPAGVSTRGNAGVPNKGLSPDLAYTKT
jgi:hypothetical protein